MEFGHLAVAAHGIDVTLQRRHFDVRARTHSLKRRDRRRLEYAIDMIIANLARLVTPPPSQAAIPAASAVRDPRLARATAAAGTKPEYVLELASLVRDRLANCLAD